MRNQKYIVFLSSEDFQVWGMRHYLQNLIKYMNKNGESFESVSVALDSFDHMASIHHVDLFVLNGSMAMLLTNCLDKVRKLKCNFQAPLITILHDVSATPTDFEKERIKACGNVSDCIVVLSKYHAHLLKTRYNIHRSKLITLPYPIEPIVYNWENSTLDSGGFLHNKKNILTLGPIEAKRGIDNALKVMKILKDTGHDFRYIIVNPEEHKEENDLNSMYIEMIDMLIRDYELTEHVWLIDKTLSAYELREIVSMCDVYYSPVLDKVKRIDPYLHYPLYMQKKIVCNRYKYAEEIAGDNVLFTYDNDYVSAEQLKSAMNYSRSKHSPNLINYDTQRKHTWKGAIQDYKTLFNEIMNANMILAM